MGDWRFNEGRDSHEDGGGNVEWGDAKNKLTVCLEDPWKGGKGSQYAS